MEIEDHNPDTRPLNPYVERLRKRELEVVGVSSDFTEPHPDTQKCNIPDQEEG